LSLHSYQSVDRKQLAKDIREIHRQALANIGIDDFEHLTRMERWGKMCSILGYGSAWIFPNPISALLISLSQYKKVQPQVMALCKKYNIPINGYHFTRRFQI
jgi:hypothetical protein